MAEMTFTCGHSADIPAHAGRGQARVRRLTEYFGRKCLLCKIQDYKQFVTTLTDIHAQPLSQEVQTQKVIEKTRELAKTYKYIGK